MHLADKLASISNGDTVKEIDRLLDQAHVSINWYGQRVFSVQGYEGAVEINALAQKYLQVNAFRQNTPPSLQERLDCYKLWGRVEKLYIDSDRELKKTWLVKYLTFIKEIKLFWSPGHPMAIIREDYEGITKNSIFEFFPEEFREIWPGVEPQSKAWLCVGRGQNPERWIATQEMVERDLSRRNG